MMAENNTYKEALNLMTHALTNLDKHVIGIANFTTGHEPIIEVNESTFITYKVGSLFGSSTDHYPISKFGIFVKLFPDNKTLAQMKENPFEFDKFCKSINI